MKKRQTLFLNKCPYDLLMEMNHSILHSGAKIEISKEQTVNACVLDCFMDSERCYRRCQFYRMDCDKCLQDFLNEED